MKNVVFILFLILCIGSASGQNKLLSVPEEMRNRPWLDQEEHLIWDHEITMFFAENLTAYRHMNVGEFTTLAYQSPDQIIQNIKDQAVKEGWGEEALKQKISFYEESAPGGRIMIFLSRYDEEEANTRWYFVILRDANDQKILEQKLNYQAPETPEGLGWWNYYEFLLNERIDLPFYVYLNKYDSEFLSDYKFKVSLPDE